MSNEILDELKQFSTEFNTIGNNIKTRLKEAEDEKQKEKLNNEFNELIGKVTSIGKKLNDFNLARQIYNSENIFSKDILAKLSFCGFLEGDFFERHYIPMPILLSGGFFLHTKLGNILFDPGMGTIVGMRDLGINLTQETNAIFVSHYHPSARFDLHTLLNELGGHCHGRSKSPVKKSIKIPLLGSTALINGRNNHPSVLIPSDRQVIDPIEAFPNQAWYLKNQQLTPAEFLKSKPLQDSLLIQTFPAYHHETMQDGNDDEGIKGQCLSSIFIETPEYGIFFTGDTEYPQLWGNEIFNYLKDRVTILIANMKTICYLPQAQNNQTSQKTNELPLTWNQLGFEGTYRLAEILKPKMLVIRALGLECVVDEDTTSNKKILRYHSERLDIYQRVMAQRLGNKVTVIIPGRHEIFLSSNNQSITNPSITLTEKTIVPAYQKMDLKIFGNDERQFITANYKLAKEINGHISLLKSTERPFLVIEGESGGGKTQLAHAIAMELVNKKNLITSYDLAVVGSESDIYGKILVGWKSRFFTGADEHPGLLSGRPNTEVLILNQLEKLPSSQSRIFLDIIEDWKYHRYGEERLSARTVGVKIIFTTNIPIRSCDNLSADLKNRLMNKRLSLTTLDSLPIADRKRDIDVFVNNWCDKNEVIMSPEGLNILYKLNLSEGSFRILRGILELSKFLSMNEYGLQNLTVKGQTFPIYVDKIFIYEAISRNQVKFASEEKVEVGKISKRLACIIAIWVSYSCINQDTYKKLKSGQGTSPNAFNGLLKKFRHHFNSSEEAWKFLQGNNQSKKALEKQELLNYLDSLETTSEEINLGDLFDKIDDEWTMQRAVKLNNLIYNDINTENVKISFSNKLT